MKKIILFTTICISQFAFAQVSKPYTCRLPLNENQIISTVNKEIDINNDGRTPTSDKEDSLNRIFSCWKIPQRKAAKPGTTKDISYYLTNLDKKDIHKSIHQEESEKYSTYNLSTNEQWDSLRTFETGIPHPIATQKSGSRACNLTKRVYGWHPYWSAGLDRKSVV